MRLWVVVAGALVVSWGCKEEPACVAHVECGTLRCIEGTCQDPDEVPDPPEPESPEPEGPEPEGPEPEGPEPEGPEPDGQPEPEPDDMGPPPDDGVEPEPDMGPEPGPDREIFQTTIQGLLIGQCSSCHPGPATPGDGVYNTENAMFGNLYEEVQEFLDLRLPNQSPLLNRPTGVDHPVIWQAGTPDYDQVLAWIETGRI